MKSIFLWGIFATSIFLADASQAHDYLDNNAYYAWEKITVPKRQYVVRAGNDFRRIKPSCASGKPYSFHFKPGNRDKLVVYYNGGGACYDDNTCVGSLTPPSNKPVYVPSVEVANDPAHDGRYSRCK